MIEEIPFEQLDGMYDPDAVFVICCDIPADFVWLHNYQDCPILKPNYAKEYRAGLLSINEFEYKYKSKLKSPIVKEYVKYLKSLENPCY